MREAHTETEKLIISGWASSLQRSRVEDIMVAG